MTVILQPMREKQNNFMNDSQLVHWEMHLQNIKCPTDNNNLNNQDFLLLFITLVSLLLSSYLRPDFSSQCDDEEKEWRKRKYTKRIKSIQKEKKKKKNKGNMNHQRKRKSKKSKRCKNIQHYTSHAETWDDWYNFDANSCYNGMMYCKNIMFDMLRASASEVRQDSSVFSIWQHRDVIYGSTIYASKKIFSYIWKIILDTWQFAIPYLQVSITFVYTSLELVWSHYSLIRKCDIALALKDVIFIFLKLGIFPGAALKFLGIPIFSTRIKKDVNIFDMINAIGKLLSLVVEASIKFYNTSDIMVFYGDAIASDFEQKYAKAIHNWPLHEAGQLDKSDGEYEREIEELWFIAGRLLADNPQDKSFYAPRLEKLHSLRVKLMLSHKVGIRIKPLGILMCGSSGVGKTTIATAIARYILHTNDFDSNQRSIVTLNDMDKFMSEVRSFHNAYILDDVAQGKPDKADGNPLLRIFQMLSNIPMAILTAIAELKGEIMMNPKVVLATTNVPHLNAHAYVASPGAVARRFELHVTQRAKKEFCYPNSSNLDPDKCKIFSNDTIPDYATFDIKYVSLSQGKDCDNSYKMVPYKHRGKPMFDVDTGTFIECIRDVSVAHFKAQRALVENYNAKKDVKPCEHHNLPEVCHACKVKRGETIPVPNVNEDLYANMDVIPRETTNAFPEDPVEDDSAGEANFESQVFGIDNLFVALDWLSSIEEYICNSLELFIRRLLCTTPIIMWWYKKKVKNIVCMWFIFATLLVGYMCCCCVHNYLSFDRLLGCTLAVLVLTNIVVYTHIALFVSTRKKVFSSLLVPRPSRLISSMSWTQKMAFVSALGGMVMLKKYVAYIISLKSHMAKFIHLKNEGAKFEPEHWSDVGSQAMARPSELDEKAKTGTKDQLIARLRKIQSVMTIMDGDRKFSRCNCLPIKSDFWLIPNHMVPSKQMNVTVDRPGTYSINTTISPHNCFKYEGTDFAIWKFANGGSQKDITHYFAKSLSDETVQEVVMLFNDGNEVKQFSPMACTKRQASTTKGGTFWGYEYDFPGVTFNGQCMATLVALRPQAYILGWHLAGKGSKGFAGFITQDGLKKTMDAFFSQCDYTFESASAVPLVTNQMNKEFGPLKPPHELSVVHSLPKDSVVTVYGDHALPSTTWKSHVKTLQISESVTNIMGIKKIHGKPVGLNAKEYELKDMIRRTHTVFNFDHNFMNEVYKDYKNQVLGGINPNALKKIGKLDLDNCIAGADGVFGANHVAYTTSTGFPKGKSKDTYLADSERLVPGIECPKDLDEDIVSEVRRILNCYLRRESASTIFNGAKKDAPTLIGSGSVRIFAGCNFAFCIVVRMYYLTLAKLVMENPYLFECAMGLNVNSPEWTKAVEHITKQGKDRIIAGDYKKYDSAMSIEFMQMAFKILIDIAKLSGNYDEEDIMIMEGIATDICNPTLNYFGTLVRFAGSNPSGHPLTTIINSIVNSLYMRYVYFVIAKDWWCKPPPFSQVVSLLTYGDDNAMSVKKGYDCFNHTRVMEELAKCGIKYTMADKDSKSIPFIGIKDLSFLKHTPRFDEDLKLYRAEIDPSSIAKQLHCHKLGALSNNMACREAIHNVLNNYFEYGDKVYTERMMQLAKVAEECDLSGIVGTLPSYSEKMAAFREKYLL